MQRIESSDNNRIKRLSSLKMKKVRLKENLFLMEGLKSVSEAVNSNADINMILISDSFMSGHTDFCAKLEQKNIPLYIAKDYNLAKCSSSKTPQGIIAAVNLPDFTFEEVVNIDKPLVVLDRLNDPGNLGTIIRSADAFDFGAVLLLSGCADAYSPKTVQSTMGSILRIKCIEIEENNLDELKESGFILFGMDLEGSDMSCEDDFIKKSAVIIGSESHGLSVGVLEKCDKKLKISMHGNAESLNASVAAGIILNKISSEVYSK